MIEMLESAMEKPGFWILGAGGTAAVLIGWIMSKKSGWVALPLWQILATIVIIWVASVFFASQD